MKETILGKEPIQLLPVTDDDLELLMAWRSHPEVYRNFFLQDGPLSWDGHYQFWKSRQDRIDWIIYFNDGSRNRKVGSVNVTNLSNECPEVGIFIGEITLMGKGIGKQTLGLIVDWLKDKEYSKARAHISKENIPSQRLFSSLGFKQSGEIHEGAEWIYVIILSEEK